MDYQEVVELLKSANRSNDMVGILPKSDISKFIIHAMQELQEYHKTGLSPKQVADTICELSATKRVLGHYQQLGTLEELKELSELSKEERPIAVLGTFGGEEYECKNCGSPVEYLDEYCRCCGQKQDWE